MRGILVIVNVIMLNVMIVSVCVVGVVLEVRMVVIVFM